MHGRLVARLAQPAVSKLAYFRAWAAAWQVAWTGAAAGLQAVPFLGHGHAAGNTDDSLSATMRSVEGLDVALGAAREPARAAAWRVALDVFTQAPGHLP